MSYKTHNCGALRGSDIGKEVSIAGWVQTIRKFGSITFVDIRDKFGLTQIVLSEALTKHWNDASIGREFVMQISGKVIERSNKNPQLSTGDIELEVSEFQVLSASATPPFTIEEETDGGEELRMKYRFLDLRRAPLQRNLLLRYEVNKAIRKYLDAQGFMEIETPFLIRSTPEGARDFVVPSRMNEGTFYALPQSPQTFKQLLMIAGYDRYFQITKCFRDEDLRADRQPEFTQIDCEMSFVHQEDVLETFEGMMKFLLKEIKQIDYAGDFPRMSWTDAMRRYGNDKPDIRFGMELISLKAPTAELDRNDAAIDLTTGGNFKIIDESSSVIGICVSGAAEYSRKQLDELTDWVKRLQVGMTGMMYVKYQADGGIKSSIDKFYQAEQLQRWLDAAEAKPGDLLLLLSGEASKTRSAASALRMELAKRMDLRNPAVFAPLWVLDFPLLEYAENNEDGGGAGRWVARHHPFTSPKPDQIALLGNPEEYPYILANAYDLIMNGNELGGGSIRIHTKELQEQMFKALCISDEEAEDKFDFLLKAFTYGAPPHGGIAFGFDRIVALLGGDESIRDYIAFPKNNAGKDVMINAPSSISDTQLEELGLHVLSLKNDSKE